MSSVNKVMLVGNVGKDPDIRSMQNGEKVASFSLATSETWRDKASGERKSRTEWHNVVVFNENIVRVVEAYVRKGSRLYVEGAIQTRKFTDKNGVERYATEIVLQRFRGEIQLLDKREDDEAPRARARARESVAPASGGSASMLEDEIPFAPEWR